MPAQKKQLPSDAPRKALRFPVEHPDFLYPLSKNPYSGRLQRFDEVVFSGQASETHPSYWRSQMPDQLLSPPDLAEPMKNRELHVEIGCNAGHVIVEWAHKNPQHCYIGMDWKFKPIFRAAEKAERRNLKNLIFFRSHAERISFAFGPREIDFLYLFFPDPWPKQAHWKHRFINTERLKKISEIVKKTGVFHIKTDHAEYFERILEAVHACQNDWQIIEQSHDLHRHHPHPESLQIPEVTLFEKLFIKDRLPIHSLKIRPKL